MTTDKLNPTTDLWDQDVYINGALDSSVSTSKGQKGQIFYISIECASGVGTCAEHPAHSKSPTLPKQPPQTPTYLPAESRKLFVTGG